MKYAFLSVLLTAVHISAVYAQVPDGATEDAFLARAVSDERLQHDMMDRLELLDVNVDNAVSSTEMEEMVKGVETIDRLTPEEKKNTAEHINEAFKKADTDKDNMLRGDELKKFGENMQEFLLRQQFKKMDRNGDGVYNLADMPSMEESMKMLEEAVQKMQETIDKVNAMDENELAQNFIQGISTSIAREDYKQMDKNHDNCVTKDEYADYNVKIQEERQKNEETAEDEKIVLSREDFMSFYIQEKKKIPECLTMEEYVENQNKILENFDQSEAEFVAQTFDETDKNHDGKVSEDEYVEYEKSTAAPEIQSIDQRELFRTIKGSEKGWVTKEEYVAGFVAEGSASDAASQN
ncbi:MAG: hypothetical protein J6N49_01200 [Alphaproteobacteria bacterium]|nr:hypothetical protein [Alphaproteobacteria bacterium]